jgi:tRNA-(ms[2]io[6]A)-hydroxylase
LLFGAIVEARSCERFTRLLEVLRDSDPEVARLLADLGPAEKRHWQLFYRLAGREVAPEALAERVRGWLELDRDLALAAGVLPTVHG